MTKKELIDKKLKDKGYTIKEIAKMLSVSEQTIYNIRSGVTSGENTILRFVKLLEIDINEWLNVE